MGRVEEIRSGEGRQVANMYQAEELGLCAGEGSGEPLEAETKNAILITAPETADLSLTQSDNLGSGGKSEHLMGT